MALSSATAHLAKKLGLTYEDHHFRNASTNRFQRSPPREQRAMYNYLPTAYADESLVTSERTLGGQAGRVYLPTEQLPDSRARVSSKVRDSSPIVEAWQKDERRRRAQLRKDIKRWRAQQMQMGAEWIETHRRG